MALDNGCLANQRRFMLMIELKRDTDSLNVIIWGSNTWQ